MLLSRTTNFTKSIINGNVLNVNMPKDINNNFVLGEILPIPV